MIDMKCPICNKPMQISYPSASGYHYCYNCGISSGGIAYKALERTRKALEIAVDALKDIDKTRSVANHKIGTQDKTLNSGIVFCWTTPDEVHNALEQITALEQKDVK